MNIDGLDNQQRCEARPPGSSGHDAMATGCGRQHDESITARDILDAIPTCAMLVDEEHRVILPNKVIRESLKVGSGEAEGEDRPRVVPRLGECLPDCPLEEAVATCRPIERRLFDGRTGCWVDVAVYPTGARTREGRRVFLHLVRDVTQAVRSEEGMREALGRAEAQRLEARASMARGIVHEVNNTLAMVTLWANIAETRTQEPEVREAIANVIKAAMDGAETMQRLRRFSQQRRTSEHGPLDLNEIVADAILFTRPMWKDDSEARDIHIEVIQELGDVPELIGDPAALREVMVNLIANAIEAMPQGGCLTVRTYAKGGRVYLEVSDTGIGIADNIKERIFEPYFSTRERDGSGSGLPAVKAIITAHGGEIQVKSALGEGSTFTVWLPIDGAGSGEVGAQTSG